MNVHEGGFARQALLLLILALSGCGEGFPADPGEPDDMLESSEDALGCSSTYCDASLRAAIKAALSDGRIYEHEVGTLTSAAMDGPSVTANESADLRRLLSLEGDRIDPAAQVRITDFLESCNWRKALPKGLLHMRAQAANGVVIHLRGENPGAIRLAYELTLIGKGGTLGALSRRATCASWWPATPFVGRSFPAGWRRLGRLRRRRSTPGRCGG